MGTKRLLVSSEFLEEVLKGRSRPYLTDAPADLRVVGLAQTARQLRRGILEILVSSEEFKDGGELSLVVRDYERYERVKGCHFV